VEEKQNEEKSHSDIVHTKGSEPLWKNDVVESLKPITIFHVKSFVIAIGIFLKCEYKNSNICWLKQEKQIRFFYDEQNESLFSSSNILIFWKKLYDETQSTYIRQTMYDAV
jgi:hypothetical protein